MVMRGEAVPSIVRARHVTDATTPGYRPGRGKSGVFTGMGAIGWDFLGSGSSETALAATHPIPLGYFSFVRGLPRYSIILKIETERDKRVVDFREAAKAIYFSIHSVRQAS